MLEEAQDFLYIYIYCIAAACILRAVDQSASHNLHRLCEELNTIQLEKINMIGSSVKYSILSVFTDILNTSRDRT